LRLRQRSAKIEEQIAPFQAQVTQLDEVTGIGLTCAQELIAELGVDMTVFPTASHLVAWARFCPQTKQSAGKNKGSGATGNGNPWLAAALGEIAGACCRTPTFLGARYRRIAKRRGNGRALVAVCNSILTITWHLLSDPQAHYQDLGPDFYDTRAGRDRQARNLVRQLERLTGQKVSFQPAA
jgi:transposase